IEMPKGFINSFSDEEAMSQFIGIRFPFEVLDVTPESPAEAIGLQKGDKILAVNDQKVSYFNDLQDALADFADQKVLLSVQRGDETIQKSAHINEDGTIGIAVNALLEPVNKKYTFLEAIPQGTERAFSVVIINARAMGKMF